MKKERLDRKKLKIWWWVFTLSAVLTSTIASSSMGYNLGLAVGYKSSADEMSEVTKKISGWFSQKNVCSIILDDGVVVDGWCIEKTPQKLDIPKNTTFGKQLPIKENLIIKPLPVPTPTRLHLTQ